MMQSVGKHRQRGMSGFGLIVFLGILGFSLWIFFTVLPMYLEIMRLDKTMEFLEKEITNDTSKRNAGAVQTIIAKNLNVEGSEIPIYKKEVFNQMVNIQRSPFIVTLKYDQEANLVANVWLSVKYEKTIEAP